MWHDGTGYDLEAASDKPRRPGSGRNSRNRIDPITIRAIGETSKRSLTSIRRELKAAVEAALKHADGAVRREAMELRRGGKKSTRVIAEKLLVKAVERGKL